MITVTSSIIIYAGIGGIARMYTWSQTDLYLYNFQMTYFYE